MRHTVETRPLPLKEGAIRASFRVDRRAIVAKSMPEDDRIAWQAAALAIRLSRWEWASQDGAGGIGADLEKAAQAEE